MKNLIIGFMLGVILTLVFNPFSGRKFSIQSPDKQSQLSESIQNFSYFNLPQEYFSKDNVIWGEVSPYGNSKFQKAAYRDGFQSYPTTDVKISNYSSDIIEFNSKPNFSIFSKDEFDVNADGKSESIISLAENGVNHPPHYWQILKSGMVIFTFNEFMAKIYSSDTNNGFFIEWYPEKVFDQGLCCPSGLTRTRFVYQDNQFVPVYEQDIVFLKVGKE